ncbi:putative toxin-antitoxin system toxin component, PIN family [Zunongwangia sp. F363]|uniref:Toxin-antitoxin system toxin component, PIN family n=1 Tax=Autumnicola tepida TaxID=3075595 RepID=A0ABU3C553_9FLAO|nr:putative toxin-antitoxin system toxin component, PIN family [Zunongwangia sp. F363]MDT0641413.1 putative toxin-antitoxin system toxin component, PIN family [Zunongwangia sp. F363]
MKSKRIILDTNLWISFLISKNFNKIDHLIQTADINLIFSNESLEEFIEVVGRPKFKKFFSKKDIEKLLDLFDQYAELVAIKSKINICRDPKDNFLLNLAVDGKADYLVTGDSDLLVLEKIGKTKIVTYSNLIKRISGD